MDTKSPELIEHEMQQTRQALSDKVAALENQVVGTIQSATSAVQETVDSVKSAVNETVSSVRDTVGDVRESVADSMSSVSEGVMHAFDVRHHVDMHPWLMVGGAAAAGLVTGLLVFRAKSGTGLGAYPSPLFSHAAFNPPPAPAPARQAPPQKEEPRRPGLLDDLFEMVGREVKKLGEAALASVVASVQKNINDGLPRLIDNALHVPDRTDPEAAARRPNGVRTQHQV